ncbi:hypothetical protein HQ531_14375 [bacterium]|nr:hypothetical protein [bacterium]
MSKEYRVAGAVTNLDTGEPVSNVIVRAFDKDFFRDQPLGKARTDKVGRYEVLFNRDDFTGPLIHLERRPDIFLEIVDAKGNIIYSTECSAVVNAWRDTRIDVAVPMPNKPEEPSIVHIGGEPVNLIYAAQLTSSELVEIYSYWRRPMTKLSRPEFVQRAFPGLPTKRDSGDDCGEGYGDVIRQLLEERGATKMLADTDADDLPAGADIKWFYTDNIAVKYTIDNAYPDDKVDSTTPAADIPFALTDGTALGTLRANLTDLHADNSDLAPSYVQKVGLLAEYALTSFIGLTFSLRDPRNGAARMEYRILKQNAGIAGQTNASWSHVEVKPGNSDSQNSFTVPHELFHQVQYRYNNTTTRSNIYGIVREGGARFATESINDQPNRYVDSGKKILNEPWQSLVSDAVGIKNPIRYAAGLLWKYMAEQHSTVVAEPMVGVDIYRKVLEATATVEASDPGIGYLATALRDARRQMPWYGRWDQFRYYDVANTELDSHETTWGNYLAANYVHSTANPVLDTRFEYREDEAPVPINVATTKLADYQANVEVGDDIDIGQGGSITRNRANHKPWAARYYRISPDVGSLPRMLKINFSTAAGMTDPLIQILRFGVGGTLLDISRSDQANYSKTINMDGLENVVVIVASRENSGSFTLDFDEVASDTDVHVTRWNSAVGTEYEVNPKGWSWTWVSPDIMVDNDDNGLADTEVYFDQNNKLKIRLRNRGNTPASNIGIEFFYQKATPHLSASAWIPVQNSAGVVQSIVGETLDAAGGANDEKWFSVDWAPTNDGTDHKHWCVKSVVTVPGDPNSDNKVVFSNFGNVIVSSDGDTGIFNLLLRYPDSIHSLDMIVLPRGVKWMATLPHNIDIDFAKNRKLKYPPCNGKPSLVAEIPNRSTLVAVKMKTMNKAKKFDGKSGLIKPEPNEYYPIPRETLPPGVDPASLVTVAYRVDGEVVGGVSFQVSTKSTTG